MVRPREPALKHLLLLRGLAPQREGEAPGEQEDPGDAAFLGGIQLPRALRGKPGPPRADPRRQAGAGPRPSRALSAAASDINRKRAAKALAVHIPRLPVPEAGEFPLRWWCW